MFEERITRKKFIQKCNCISELTQCGIVVMHIDRPDFFFCGGHFIYILVENNKWSDKINFRKKKNSNNFVQQMKQNKNLILETTIVQQWNLKKKFLKRRAHILKVELCKKFTVITFGSSLQLFVRYFFLSFVIIILLIF